MKENRNLIPPCVSFPLSGRGSSLSDSADSADSAERHECRFMEIEEYIPDCRTSQVELRRELIGEYAGSHAPSVWGNTPIVRNRTRILIHISFCPTGKKVRKRFSSVRKRPRRAAPGGGGNLCSGVTRAATPGIPRGRRSSLSRSVSSGLSPFPRPRERGASRPRALSRRLRTARWHIPVQRYIPSPSHRNP